MRRTKYAQVVGLCGLLALPIGCGGGAESEVAEADSADESSGSEADEPADGAGFEGLQGTLSQQEVESALEPRMLKFAVCASKRQGAIEFLAGGMAFHFVVDRTGHVSDVYGTRSGLGDRKTEVCMLKVARKAKFPKPHGGAEAEFDWFLEIPTDPNYRQPIDWGAENAEPVVAEQGPESLANCGSGPFDVIAYVDTEGRVMGAGVSNGQSGAEESLDCVAAAVEGWTFPSPGSFAAKIAFTIP